MMTAETGRGYEELELKAVVTDPAALRAQLAAAGAARFFVGLLEDRRLDRDGQLRAKDHVLRVRTWRAEGQPARAEIGWKGPTRRSSEGLKLRTELELGVADGGAALGLLEALGFGVTQAIDRYVEVFALVGATLRLEWYPRMDVLLEVEGTPDAIDAGVRATGLPRAVFVPDALPEFVARFEAREGQAAVLSIAELHGERPTWARR